MCVCVNPELVRLGYKAKEGRGGKGRDAGEKGGKRMEALANGIYIIMQHTQNLSSPAVVRISQHWGARPSSPL